jgi:hypothetical protein
MNNDTDYFAAERRRNMISRTPQSWPDGVAIELEEVTPEPIEMLGKRGAWQFQTAESARGFLEGLPMGYSGRMRRSEESKSWFVSYHFNTGAVNGLSSAVVD